MCCSHNTCVIKSRPPAYAGGSLSNEKLQVNGLTVHLLSALTKLFAYFDRVFLMFLSAFATDLIIAGCLQPSIFAISS